MGESDEFSAEWYAKNILSANAAERIADRKKLIDPDYWHSKDGRLTRIEDMNTKHLNNTIAMLERRGVVLAIALLDEVDPVVRDAQLQMLGNFGALTLERYKNLLKERDERQDEDAHDSDARAG